MAISFDEGKDIPTQDIGFNSTPALDLAVDFDNTAAKAVSRVRVGVSDTTMEPMELWWWARAIPRFGECAPVPLLGVLSSFASIAVKSPKPT